MTFSVKMTFVGENFETLVTRIRSLQNTLHVTNEREVCFKHLKNFQGRLFKENVFLKKSIFLWFFYDFRPIFWTFHRISSARARAQMLKSARDFQNHKIHDLRSVTHFLPCPYHLSSTFWRKLNLLCRKHVLFCRVDPRKTSFWLIFWWFFNVFLPKDERFQHT